VSVRKCFYGTLLNMACGYNKNVRHLLFSGDEHV